MKRLVAVALLLNSILLLVLVVQILPLRARASDTALKDARFCVDSNGDGNVDIADAITVLSYLFSSPGSTLPLPYCIAEGFSLESLEARVTALEACTLCPTEENRTWVSCLCPGQVNIPDFDDSGYTTIRLSDVYRDHLNEYDPTTFRFTAKEGGTYLISTYVDWADVPAEKTVYHALRFDAGTATESIEPEHRLSSASNTHAVESTRIVRCDKGRTIDVMVTHNAGNNQPDVRSARLVIVRLF